MSEPVPLGAPVQVRTVERAYVETASIPWTVWCIIAGIVSGMIGGSWDISWHMSIGRDTFWTPPHILIQLTGVLAGIACTYMILTATFASASTARSAAVRIWGFRGPLGAFIAVWGCVAMLTSAPFDNWWHNAYGLDVKIVSPPHVVLMLGSLTIRIGALALLVGLMNRAQAELQRKLAWLFFYVAATCVGQLALIILEPTWLVRMHSARCYLAVAIAIPAVLIGPAWGSRRRWACPLVAAFYTAIALAFEWILPLFPAEPKLGPVYHQITHLVPLRFPLLFIVPAVIVDLILHKTEQRERWTQAALAGPAFLLSFLAAQWPFANFLISPASRNWIFGTAYFAYFDPAGFTYDPYKFIAVEKTRVEFWIVMAMALVVSIITTRLGLAWGDWMRRLRR
jgi:hypothetical protein